MLSLFFTDPIPLSHAFVGYISCRRRCSARLPGLHFCQFSFDGDYIFLILYLFLFASICLIIADGILSGRTSFKSSTSRKWSCSCSTCPLNNGVTKNQRWYFQELTCGTLCSNVLRAIQHTSTEFVCKNSLLCFFVCMLMRSYLL